MEQTANTMPAATLGQYKGLAFTRRVRPVSDKAVEADIGNLARVHAPFGRDFPVRLHLPCRFPGAGAFRQDGAV